MRSNPSVNRTRYGRRRKAIVQDIAERHRHEALARMPISRGELLGLFDHRGAALAASCDHSLRHTRCSLQARALPEAEIIPWLLEYGGGCDCEVVANVEEGWGEP